MPRLNRHCEGEIFASERAVDRSKHGGCSADQRKGVLKSLFAIYGREGTLVATGIESPQLNEVKLYGARNGNKLGELVPPARLVCVPEGIPRGDPYNVGQLYPAFADAIRTGQGSQPTFETAVEPVRPAGRTVGKSVPPALIVSGDRRQSESGS